MVDRSNVALRRWALVGILWLAFGLRLYRLGADSLWYDETVSLHLAGKALPTLVAHTAGDIHPPGYYLLLHGWVRLAGTSEFAAAFFSLFFGLLLVPLAYHLAARLFGWRVGLLAALLVALSPYNLWYSQEVRMYTLAAVLGMGLLVAVVELLTDRWDSLPSWRWLAVYSFCAALGLWVLYYFAFLLLAVNGLVLVWWLLGWRGPRARWAGSRRRAGVWLGRWALAQGAVLLLYAPWLPVAWHQANQPPVPPWRGFAPLGQVLLETWSALSLGQSVDPEQVWPVVLLFVALFTMGLVPAILKWRGGSPNARDNDGKLSWFLAGTVWLPILLVYLASFLTPLYHVRYAFTYSTPFYVLVAAGLVWLGQRWRRALGLALALLLLASGLSIAAYHTDPRYAGDDHRAATRYLAEQWRPGDAVLVDAGYAYPALLAYWDGDPLAWRGRLVDYRSDRRQPGAIILQAGSVDASPELGWGDPNSDFYAMDRATAAQALERVFADFDRVWIYRIYDTVTDSDGWIRRWLAEHGTQFEDRVFTGASQLRVQGFLTGRDPLAGAEVPLDAELADGSLQLEGATWPPHVQVGGALDLSLAWRVFSPPPADALLFAGLFDDQGQRWAQADVRPLGSLYPATAWPSEAIVRTPLRVSVPPGTPPGEYRLEVGWYRFVDGQPMWLPWPSADRLALGQVEVQRPGDWSVLPAPTVELPIGVTIGEGLRLLGLDTDVLEGYPGDTLHVDLVWQAQVDAPEQGQMVLLLTDDAGNSVAETTGPLAAGRASFAGLESGQAVRDLRSLELPGALSPGMYTLRVGRRARDGSWLAVRRGAIALGSTYPLASVRVLDRPRSQTLPAIQHPVDARFGSGVRLLGFDLNEPGADLQGTTGGLDLVLYWQCLAPQSLRYKFFAHLAGDGKPVDIRAQGDLYPHVPTTGCVPGEVASDRVRLQRSGDLPSGRYRLLVGLYDETSGQRLPAFDAGGESVGDSLLLQEIAVGE